LNDLELADSAPRRLWDAALYELHKRLMGVVEALNIKFGKDTVRCGLFPNSVPGGPGLSADRRRTRLTGGS
jgi:hypothetical protein